MDLTSLKDENGYMKIAAFDHRSSMMKYVPEDKVQDIKLLFTETFSPVSTAILVDPIYGHTAIESAKKAGIGILLSRAKSGYREDAEGRITELLEDYNSQTLKDLGATAIKILMFYNSVASNSNQQVEILAKVKEECNKADLPLLVEPLAYPVEGHPYHRGDVTIRMIQDLRQYVDVFKLQYPVDVDEEEVEAGIPYLEQIDYETNSKPWILLSRGMEYEKYKHALKLSKDAGAKGYAVGRAVWQELADIESWDDKVSFVKGKALNRMKELSSLF